MQDIIVRYVYELIDPFTKKTRYVGCAKDPHGRLRGHVHESANRPWSKDKSDWINSLVKKGVKPIVKVVDSAIGDAWEAAEEKWIAYHRRLGSPLTNRTDGGLGQHGCVATEETRQKRSETQTGRIHTPESIEKMSAAQRQAWATKRDHSFSQAYKDHMSAVHPYTHLTHCKHGHPLIEENIYWTIGANGRRHRHCRTCRAAAMRRYQQSGRRPSRAKKK